MTLVHVTRGTPLIKCQSIYFLEELPRLVLQSASRQGCVARTCINLTAAVLQLSARAQGFHNVALLTSSVLSLPKVHNHYLKRQNV